nr:transcription initiation factor TFIID subunit 15 isoform X1 [Tanacetum cinerariifolium]
MSQKTSHNVIAPLVEPNLVAESGGMGRGRGDASRNAPPKAWQQDGDWMYPNTSCTNVNFAFRGVCNHCGSAGPVGASVGGGGRVRGRGGPDSRGGRNAADGSTRVQKGVTSSSMTGHNDPKHLFAKDGIDSLFAARDTSVAESACHGAYTAKTGASPMLLTGEQPWSTPTHDRITPSGIRNDVVLRYKEKKKNRNAIDNKSTQMSDIMS